MDNPLTKLLKLIVNSPDISRTIVANCTALIEREQVGLKKYGTSLEASGLSRADLLQHAREEALDLANYLEAAIEADTVQDLYQAPYKDLYQAINRVAFDEQSKDTVSQAELRRLLQLHRSRHPNVRGLPP